MQPIEITCPVQGMWAFMNPPGHHPNAKDFVAVDTHGRPYPGLRLVAHLFYRLNITDTCAWSKPVFSPFDGLVVTAEKNRADRKTLNLFRDFIVGLFIAPHRHANEPLFFPGNYLIIKSDTGVYAMLAHLKQGSILLAEGERVKAGAPVAEVGNSGNSIQPHLHFQLMNENDPMRAVPQAFVMQGIERKEKSHWQKASSVLPDNYAVFRTH